MRSYKNILRLHLEKWLLICIKIQSLNVQINVSNKFIPNSSNSDFNLEQWQVEVESTKKKVKGLKVRDFLDIF